MGIIRISMQTIAGLTSFGNAPFVAVGNRIIPVHIVCGMIVSETMLFIRVQGQRSTCTITSAVVSTVGFIFTLSYLMGADIKVGDGHRMSQCKRKRIRGYLGQTVIACSGNLYKAFRPVQVIYKCTAGSKGKYKSQGKNNFNIKTIFLFHNKLLFNFR